MSKVRGNLFKFVLVQDCYGGVFLSFSVPTVGEYIMDLFVKWREQRCLFWLGLLGLFLLHYLFKKNSHNNQKPKTITKDKILLWYSLAHDRLYKCTKFDRSFSGIIVACFFFLSAAFPKPTLVWLLLQNQRKFDLYNMYLGYRQIKFQLHAYGKTISFAHLL